MRNTPLAISFRPKSFDEYVGQKKCLIHVLQSVQAKKPHSFVFWGPPGSGKTTLAELYCKSFSHPVEKLHATTTGTQELKQIIERTKSQSLLFNPTIVWIDEVHRLTRVQQDTLLASVEEGALILVSATTENPSFQLTPALLSRVRVVTLSAHTDADLHTICRRVLERYPKVEITDDALQTIISWAQGDARALLNMLESLLTVPKKVEKEDLAYYIQKKQASFDPTGEGRYTLISALHKAIRGSDCQAALYWLCRLIVQGEDVRYIARRLIRMATEDIGLADPQALDIAINGLKAYETLGNPEGSLAIAEVAVYLALAPKSNALYKAFSEATKEAEKTTHMPPPKHIINAPTKWMQKEGYAQDYKYDHDCEAAFSGQNYFPDSYTPNTYYSPVMRGFERELAKRLDYFSKLKNA